MSSAVNVEGLKAEQQQMLKEGFFGVSWPATSFGKEKLNNHLVSNDLSFEEVRFHQQYQLGAQAQRMQEYWVELHKQSIERYAAVFGQDLVAKCLGVNVAGNRLPDSMFTKLMHEVGMLGPVVTGKAHAKFGAQGAVGAVGKSKSPFANLGNNTSAGGSSSVNPFGTNAGQQAAPQQQLGGGPQGSNPFGSRQASVAGPGSGVAQQQPFPFLGGPGPGASAASSSSGNPFGAAGGGGQLGSTAPATGAFGSSTPAPASSGAAANPFGQRAGQVNNTATPFVGGGQGQQPIGGGGPAGGQPNPFGGGVAGGPLGAGNAPLQPAQTLPVTGTFGAGAGGFGAGGGSAVASGGLFSGTNNAGVSGGGGLFGGNSNNSASASSAAPLGSSGNAQPVAVSFGTRQPGDFTSSRGGGGFPSQQVSFGGNSTDGRGAANSTFGKAPAATSNPFGNTKAKADAARAMADLLGLDDDDDDADAIDTADGNAGAAGVGAGLFAPQQQGQPGAAQQPGQVQQQGVPGGDVDEAERTRIEALFAGSEFADGQIPLEPPPVWLRKTWGLETDKEYCVNYTLTLCEKMFKAFQPSDALLDQLSKRMAAPTTIPKDKPLLGVPYHTAQSPSKIEERAEVPGRKQLHRAAGERLVGAFSSAAATTPSVTTGGGRSGMFRVASSREVEDRQKPFSTTKSILRQDSTTTVGEVKQNTNELFSQAELSVDAFLKEQEQRREQHWSAASMVGSGAAASASASSSGVGRATAAEGGTGSQHHAGATFTTTALVEPSFGAAISKASSASKGSSSSGSSFGENVAFMSRHSTSTVDPTRMSINMGASHSVSSYEKQIEEENRIREEQLRAKSLYNMSHGSNCSTSAQISSIVREHKKQQRLEMNAARDAVINERRGGGGGIFASTSSSAARNNANASTTGSTATSSSSNQILSHSALNTSTSTSRGGPMGGSGSATQRSGSLPDVFARLSANPLLQGTATGSRLGLRGNRTISSATGAGSLGGTQQLLGMPTSGVGNAGADTAQGEVDAPDPNAIPANTKIMVTENGFQYVNKTTMNQTRAHSDDGPGNGNLHAIDFHMHRRDPTPPPGPPPKDAAATQGESAAVRESGFFHSEKPVRESLIGGPRSGAHSRSHSLSSSGTAAGGSTTSEGAEGGGKAKPPLSYQDSFSSLVNDLKEADTTLRSETSKAKTDAGNSMPRSRSGSWNEEGSEDYGGGWVARQAGKKQPEEVMKMTGFLQTIDKNHDSKTQSSAHLPYESDGGNLSTSAPETDTETEHAEGALDRSGGAGAGSGTSSGVGGGAGATTTAADLLAGTSFAKFPSGIGGAAPVSAGASFDNSPSKAAVDVPPPEPMIVPPSVTKRGPYPGNLSKTIDLTSALKGVKMSSTTTTSSSATGAGTSGAAGPPAGNVRRSNLAATFSSLPSVPEEQARDHVTPKQSPLVKHGDGGDLVRVPPLGNANQQDINLNPAQQQQLLEAHQKRRRSMSTGGGLGGGGSSASSSVSSVSVSSSVESSLNTTTRSLSPEKQYNDQLKQQQHAAVFLRTEVPQFRANQLPGYVARRRVATRRPRLKENVPLHLLGAPPGAQQANVGSAGQPGPGMQLPQGGGGAAGGGGAQKLVAGSQTTSTTRATAPRNRSYSSEEVANEIEQQRLRLACKMEMVGFYQGCQDNFANMTAKQNTILRKKMGQVGGKLWSQGGMSMGQSPGGQERQAAWSCEEGGMRSARRVSVRVF
eukprot:g5743.t1